MRIVEDDLTGDAIRALLQVHFDRMVANSPAGSCHFLDLDGLRADAVTFWSIWDGNDDHGNIDHDDGNNDDGNNDDGNDDDGNNDDGNNDDGNNDDGNNDDGNNDDGNEGGSDDLAGCGALKVLDAYHGEVKSMRTADRHLGKGVGQEMLDHIVGVARQRSYERLSLQTGSGHAFAAATRLYVRSGFVECGPFADYQPDPFGRFYTLRL